MHAIAEAVQGRHIGVNAQIDTISIDSRTLEKGALFVALRGARFNGHQFVDEAITKGAGGILVDTATDASIPQVVVPDTELALGQLAAHWRGCFDIPVVAVTGSNGKTTVKEMIGCILRTNTATLVSQGNFNNPVGLPLSLLKLQALHGFAVVEIGMNQVGEIEKLASIARPTVAVITNAGAAHLEKLVSVDQVAIEKGQIIAALGAQGIAVLNYDSPHYSIWRATANPREIVTFGLAREAHVTASYTTLEFGSMMQVETPRGRFDVELQLAGEHNVVNALAATAVGVALDIPLMQIKSGLVNMRAVTGRLQLRKHFRGGSLIDDTYNANPNSVAAALAFLSRLDGDRRLVFGDMFELGVSGEEFHRDVGRLARGSGIGRLYALGELSAAAVQEFGRGARHYRDRDALIKDLGADLDATTTVLIKGSRGMKMDEIADFLCATDQQKPGVQAC